MVAPRLSLVHKDLNKIKTVTEILLENAEILVERVRTDRVELGEEQLREAHDMISTSSISLLAQSSLYLNYTTEELKEQAYETVGSSPNPIDDIVAFFKGIVDWIVGEILGELEKLVEAVDYAFRSALGVYTSLINTILSNIVRAIETAFGTALEYITIAITEIETYITTGFEWILEGFELFTQALLTGFSLLITELKDALSIEPEDFMNFLFKMQEMSGNAQVAYIKKIARKYEK